ncbi:MAG: 5'/3'-nucleotidase SurE [Pseudomonadota bacterium]
MSLLLSNDDGIHAPGLQALFQALQNEHDVMVIAPDRDKSGVSNCLTLDRPLQANQIGPQHFAVDGTPTDCIHLGTAGIFIPQPTRVLSGINLGANLGDDVLYSGTVAAAMEGRFLPRTAMAISLVVTDYGIVNVERFQTAAAITKWLLSVIDSLSLPVRTVLNVNIPDLPAEQIKGIRLTTLGQRLKGENPISTRNPRGKTLYWIGRAGGPVERNPGSDFLAVEEGYVSLTPIHADMLNKEALAAAAPLFAKLTATFDPRTFNEEVGN